MISEIVDRVALAIYDEVTSLAREGELRPRSGRDAEARLADHCRKLALVAIDAMKVMIDEALAGEKACLPPAAKPADRVGGTAP